MKSNSKIITKIVVAALGVLALARFAKADWSTQVIINSGTFYDPYTFFESDPGVKQATPGVVLIGRRGSGFMISPTLMVTARHVLEDLVSGPTEDCARIPLFLDHENRFEGDEGSARAVKIQCKRVLKFELSDDFAALEVTAPFTIASIQPEMDESKIRLGMNAFALGHPHASDFSRGVKKVTQGEIVKLELHNEELPHFIHLIDTEGGNSGGPIISSSGRALGIHFRGIPNYDPGVDVVVKGTPKKVKRFNLAIPLFYLLKKYDLDRLL